MKCSLGILCEPLKSLGLHGHKSAAKRSTKKRTTRKVAKTTRTKKRK